MIFDVEQIAYWAVPPAISLQVDGWRLRFNHGVTRRANSVWPNADFGHLSLDEKLDTAERFYQGHGSVSRFQVTSAALPAGLDDVLADRGYIISQVNNVQGADTTEVIRRTASNPALAVTLTPTWTPAWLDTYCAIERIARHRRPIYDAMWKRVPGAITFGLVMMDEQPVAVGMSVAQDGWAGLFNIATRPDYRRRGAALALLHTLSTWAAQQDASRLYLQVRDQNQPALALYQRLGFSTLYQYWYREQLSSTERSTGADHAR